MKRTKAAVERIVYRAVNGADARTMPRTTAKIHHAKTSSTAAAFIDVAVSATEESRSQDTQT